MEENDLIRFNNFRSLCLANAEDAIKTAESLLGKNVNQIVYHLSVFGLEEIGKIFVGWYNLKPRDTWDKKTYNIAFDDHIKKLFWAIWGPSFMKEKITKEQMDEVQNFASGLHQTRLEVMYTQVSDTKPSSAKVSDREAEKIIKLARARLELAKVDGQVVTEVDDQTQSDIEWFIEASDNPDKRKYIFSEQAQEKLIELGEADEWITWLQKHFEAEDQERKKLLQDELEKSYKADDQSFVPKWKIKIKLITPSHSIRPSELEKSKIWGSLAKFYKGDDNHTLIVDISLDKKIPIVELWNHGWNISNLLVTSLNVATNGIFYWNIKINPDRFYEKIWDVENNRELDAKLFSGTQVDWPSKRLYLRDEEIIFSFIVFEYLISVIGTDYFEPVKEYANAMGMLAKSDMHLHLEQQCFLHFFLSFKKAVIKNEKECDSVSFVEIGYKQIEKMLNGEDMFNRMMKLGGELESEGKISTVITLTEILAIKNYSGLYLLTLSVRKLYGDDSLKLTKDITTL